MLTTMTEPNPELNRVASDLAVMRAAVGAGHGLSWSYVHASFALAAMGAVTIAASLVARAWTRPLLLGCAVLFCLWWYFVGRRFQADQIRDPARWRAFRKEALAALIIAPFAAAYGYWARFRVVGEANWTMQTWAEVFAAPVLLAAGLIMGVQALNDVARRYQLGFAISALATAFWLPFCDDRYLALGVMLLAGGLISGTWLAMELSGRERGEHAD